MFCGNLFPCRFMFSQTDILARFFWVQVPVSISADTYDRLFFPVQPHKMSCRCSGCDRSINRSQWIHHKIRKKKEFLDLTFCIFRSMSADPTKQRHTGPSSSLYWWGDWLLVQVRLDLIQAEAQGLCSVYASDEKVHLTPTLCWRTDYKGTVRQHLSTRAREGRH